MGAPKKADWREERRKRAWKLKEEGWQQKDIARALGGQRGSSKPLGQTRARRRHRSPQGASAQEIGVRYHRDHVGRLMREAGWSRQKPVERASQRNEEAIKKWSEERWPDIKKSRRGERDHPLGR